MRPLAMDADDTIVNSIRTSTIFRVAAIEVDYEVQTDGQITNRIYEDNRKDIPFTIQFSRTEDGSAPSIAITHGGGEATFDATNWRPQAGSYDKGNNEDGTREVFWSWEGTPVEYADGDTKMRYHMPVALAHGSPDRLNFGIRRYAVIGLETPALPTDITSAEYEGDVRLQLFPKTDQGSDRSLWSDITLTANFANNTIEGTLDNWKNREDPNDNLSDAVYIIPEVEITNTGFTGTLAPGEECGACPKIVSSDITGTFYGPNADETGGTLSVEIDNTEGTIWEGEPNSVGVGVFFSKRIP